MGVGGGGEGVGEGSWLFNSSSYYRFSLHSFLIEVIGRSVGMTPFPVGENKETQCFDEKCSTK